MANSQACSLLLQLLTTVCFLRGNSPAFEFYMPTFRNTLLHLHRQVGMKNDFLPGNYPASEFYMPTFRNTLFHLHGQVGVE